MKPSRYLVEHVSSYAYDNPVQGSLMLLRLRPRDDGRQRVLKFNLHVDPQAALTELADPFGNRCHLFNVHRRHSSTVVHSRVRVEAADAPPLPETLGPDAWEALEADIDPVEGWEFLQPSQYVRFSDALEAFTSANDIGRGADPLSSLLELCARLHRIFEYDPGSTAVDSPMDHILETGRGVCQDYTHVMLAIARSWGVPSRYVSGYVHREGKEGEQSLPGASHSWGEFYIPDAGWVGIDPTNDTLADHRFVAVAVGRDYADACPTRGTVLGGRGLYAGSKGDRDRRRRNRAGLEPAQGMAESPRRLPDAARVQRRFRSVGCRFCQQTAVSVIRRTLRPVDTGLARQAPVLIDGFRP